MSLTKSNVLDDLDLVVHPLQERGANLVFAVSQDSIQTRFETSGKVLYRLDLRTNGATVPALKPIDCRSLIGVAPEVTKLLLEHVDGEQPSVQLECLIQSPSILVP